MHRSRPIPGGQSDPPGNLQTAHFHRGQWWAFRKDGHLVIWRHQRHVQRKKDGSQDSFTRWHRMGSLGMTVSTLDRAVPDKVVAEVTRAFYYLIALELLPITRITP